MITSKLKEKNVILYIHKQKHNAISQASSLYHARSDLKGEWFGSINVTEDLQKFTKGTSFATTCHVKISRQNK